MEIDMDGIDTKTAIEIGHTSDVLEKVHALLAEAYDLVSKDKIARKYLTFNSSVCWHPYVWKQLDKEYEKCNPESKEVYFLKAFDYFHLFPGFHITDGSCETNS